MVINPYYFQVVYMTCHLIVVAVGAHDGPKKHVFPHAHTRYPEIHLPFFVLIVDENAHYNLGRE